MRFRPVFAVFVPFCCLLVVLGIGKGYAQGKEMFESDSKSIVSSTKNIDSLIDHTVTIATGYDTYTLYNLRPLNSPFSEPASSAVAEGCTCSRLSNREVNVAADAMQSVVRNSSHSLCITASLNHNGPVKATQDERTIVIPTDGTTIYAAACRWNVEPSPAYDPISISCSSKEHLPNSAPVQTVSTRGEDLLKASLREVKDSFVSELVPSGLYFLRAGERTTTFVVRR